MGSTSSTTSMDVSRRSCASGMRSISSTWCPFVTASRIASEVCGRYQGLRACIGATVDQIRAELQAVNARISTLQSDADQLDEVRRTCARRIGAAEDSQTRLERSLAEQDQRRALAITDLQRFAANDLLKA